VLPNGRRLRKRFGRRRLAERWWSVQVAAIDDGSWNPLAPRTITVGEAFNHYREFARVQHRSFKSYTAPILKFWEDELGANTLLPRISAAEIERIKLRRAESRSQSTVDRALQLLKALFNWLIDHDVCVANPVKNVKLFRPNNERVRYLTSEEFDKLCSAAATIRWYLKPLIILAVVTGLRRGTSSASGSTSAT
jgi:integrase